MKKLVDALHQSLPLQFLFILALTFGTNLGLFYWVEPRAGNLGEDNVEILYWFLVLLSIFEAFAILPAFPRNRYR